MGKPSVRPRSTDLTEQSPQRGPGAPNHNGGTLLPPWSPGQSGNPSGRPKTKPVTDAYRKMLEMGLAKLATYHPLNTAEAMARALILKTFREANTSKGRLLSAIVGAKEITDRVEGTALPGGKAQQGAQKGALARAQLTVSFDRENRVHVQVGAGALTAGENEEGDDE